MIRLSRFLPGLRLHRLEKKVDRLLALMEASPGMRSVFVEDRVALVRLKDGSRLYVDPRDIGIASTLMIRGEWEAHYTALVRRIVKPGMTCVDAGANFGYYSALFAKHLRGNGQVFAFEPNPFVFSLLQRSFQANGLRDPARFHLFEVGLGTERGEAELRFDDGDYGGGSVIDSGGPANPQKATSQIQIAPLDEFNIPTDAPMVIKIDTEGSEYALLQGAQKTLQNTKNIFMILEFIPEFIERTLPVPEFVAFLRGMGFTIMVLNDGKLEDVGDNEVPPKGYVFLRKGPHFNALPGA